MRHVAKTKLTCKLFFFPIQLSRVVCQSRLQVQNILTALTTKAVVCLPTITGRFVPIRYNMDTDLMEIIKLNVKKMANGTAMFKQHVSITYVPS